MNKVSYDPEQSRQESERAGAALAAGDVAEGMACLERAFELNPFDDELPLLAAAVQLEHGDPVRAAHLALEALALRSFHPRALDVLAVACIDAHQPDAARALLRRAARMAPELANPKKNLKDARRKARELRGGAVARDEIARIASLLPLERIRALGRSEPPTLCACIVLHDDDRAALDACVRSVREIATRIVVIDARDEESGPLGLDEPHAVVHRLIGHGATARNEALRRAEGDWVLVLEAGERLEPGAEDVIAEALTQRSCLAYLVELVDEHGRGRQTVRLIRNAPGLVFSGVREARLEPAAQALAEQFGLDLGEAVATVRAPHFVRFVTPAGMEPGDVARTLDERVLEQPDNLQLQLERGWLHLEQGEAAEALQIAQRLTGRLVADDRRSRAFDLEEPTVLLGCCLRRLLQFEELGELLDSYHECFPQTPNTLFLEGVAANETDRTERAVERWLLALDLDGHTTFCPALDDVRGVALLNLLGAVAMERGELETAGAAFDLALKRDGENLEAQLGRVALHLAEGEMKRVLLDLDRLVESHGEEPNVWITGGIVLGQLPDLAPAAADWLEEAARRLPAHGEIRRRLGEAQLRSGRAEQALETWSECENEREVLTPGMVAAALASNAEIPPIPAGANESVADEVFRWFHRWMSSGALEALDRALLNLQRVEPALPGLLARTEAWLESAGQREAAAGLRGRRG